MKPLAKFLKDQMTEEDLELLPRSYDIVGSKDKSVVIIEIPDELKNKKRLVAEALMKLNRSIKSVLNKKSGRKGDFRLQDLELLAGDENTEVVHREHGYLLKMDPRKIFFSPREATERQRIASQVKPNENVCVFFSGTGVYSIAIVKKQSEANKVYGIEINPVAHNYAKENVRINKMSHKIVLINDDVENACKKLKIKFDRVVMPMAVDGEKYLDCAFKLIKDSGIIHFYSTGNDKNLFVEAGKFVINAAINNRKKIWIEKKVKVLPFGVRMYKICLDLKAGVA